MGFPASTAPDDLEYRVNQFRALKAYDRSLAVHMHTTHLINDLWNEIVRLKRLQEERK